MLRLLQRVEFPRKLGLCRAIFRHSLAKYGLCWVRTAPGPIWKLDLTNQTHQWLVFGYYEGPGFWRWLRRQSGIATIVDSGANIGQTVAYFAVLEPRPRIFAYEPGATARAWLSACVAANSFGHISISAHALGAAAGTARLQSAGSPLQHGSWNKVNEGEGEPISLVALDAELDRLGLATLDLWKLDMEGYEGAALEGARRAIESHRIRALHVEAAGETGQRNLTWLEARGYRVHGIEPSGRLTPWNPRHAFDNALCLAPGAFAS